MVQFYKKIGKKKKTKKKEKKEIGGRGVAQ